MTYLVIMVVVAAAGIATLWVQQHRQRAHLTSVDDFRSSLERISAQTDPRVRGERVRGPRSRPSTRPVPGRVTPLDPARREAAKRRLDARRAARARASR